MGVDSTQWAAHLLRRAGFGGSPEEIATYAALDYDAAVERLLNPAGVDDSAAEAALQALAARLDPTKIRDAQALWLARMLVTQRPLPEKMTLFWHNHFATGIPKVKYPSLMAQQAQLFRTAGLGDFPTLLTGVAKDPAMILWLDGETNVKAHPNENWARELMELFTIGIGNYSEQDVKEVARAFTGWGLNRRGANPQSGLPAPQFAFNPRQHDTGAKTIFGQIGRWTGDDVIRLLASRIETGKLLARKMWRWFVNDTLSEAGVARLAQVYLDSHYNIGAMLRALFLGADFQAEAAYYNTIKNPPEFIVGLFKTLGLATPALLRAPNAPATLRLLAGACDQMGMVLYNPPNVGGWPGGATWMNPTTYFARTNASETILQTQGNGRSAAVNVQALVGGASDPAAIVDTLLAAFVGDSEPAEVRQALRNYLGDAPTDLKMRGLIRLIVGSPSYQMN